MFKNYLLTAYKAYLRRKLFTAINLLCITITLMVLLVVTALLQNAFYPSGVEGRSGRYLQIMEMASVGADRPPTSGMSQPDGVAQMASVGMDGNTSRISPMGYKTIEKYLKPMKSAQLVSAVTLPGAVSVYQGDRVTQLMLRRADAQYWQILDFKVLDGRVPTADDDARGHFVAVLNHTSANRLFPGTRAVGQTLDVGGQQFKVIGVVEDAMQLNAYADIWAPISTDPSTEYKNQMWGPFIALLMGRDASDLPRMRAEVAQIATRLQFDDPTKDAHAFLWADSKPDFFARTLLGNDKVADSGAGMMLAVIAVAMLFFMLLPALNLVNLNTGRIMERSSEIGVRKAFGASSSQLVIQFVLENVSLCLVGGLLGLIFAKGVLVWLEHSGLIPYLKVDINLDVFFCGLLITLVFGLLSGVLPAWKMSRVHPVLALKGAA